MKYISLFVLLLLSKDSFSQKKQLDSVCKICDKLIVQFCGKEGISWEIIKKKKIMEDLKMLIKAQKYLSNSDTTFIGKFKSNVKLETRLSGQDSLFRIEVVYVNYFKITINTVKINGKIRKGIILNRSNTIKCKFNENYDLYDFDNRIIQKYLIKKIKYPFVYTQCGVIYINFYESPTYYGKIMFPELIKENQFLIESIFYK